MVAGDGTQDALIVLSGVHKWFGELHVLRNVSLSVDRGEVVVVIGPSGSGKSTLCRAINRLEPINDGEIVFDGMSLPAEGKELARLRSEVGMVFQSFNLFAHKSVLDNVTLGPVKVRKESRAEAQQHAVCGAPPAALRPPRRRTRGLHGRRPDRRAGRTGRVLRQPAQRARPGLP